MKKISSFLPSLVKPLYNKGKNIQAQIFLDWIKIVGPTYADCCWPKGIDFPSFKNNEARLYVVTTSGGSALHMQYVENFILDRINAFFGYKAVSKIVFSQELQRSPNLKLINNKVQTKYDLNECPSYLDDIMDNGLKDTLLSFYQSLTSPKK